MIIIESSRDLENVVQRYFGLTRSTLGKIDYNSNLRIDLKLGFVNFVGACWQEKMLLIFSNR